MTQETMSASIVGSFLRKRVSISVAEANGEMSRKFAWRFIASLAIVLAWAASAAAQTVVVGTGDPNIDVPAVQTAVDGGGQVILEGHFSFNRPPTIVPALPGFPLATILVSKSVEISGTQDDEEKTTIEGGTQPFEVEALGSAVTIQGLRFIGPKAGAINVLAVSGLVIASNRIEGVEPLPVFGSTGIGINTTFNPPTPSQPGHPNLVSGTLLIANNDINMAGGTALDNTLGITIFSVGVPGAEVEAYVSGNRIRNTTEPAINFRRIAGRAFIERNVVATGSVVAAAARPQAIRVVNSGSYLISHNSIDCEWAAADAEGIGVFSQFAAWPIERAIVVDNKVNMSAPEGTVFGNFGAAIGVFGFAQGNVVMNNRIRGHAGAALSVDVFRGGVPSNNALILNRFDDFEASVADVFVDAGVMNTLIAGPGTVEDHGTGTVIVPLPPREIQE